MAGIKRFEDFEIWKAARELTKQVCQLSETGRLGKDFGVKDQMRRASVSIMSNIDVNCLDKDQFQEMHNMISKCTRQISVFMKYLQGSKIRSRI